MTTNQEMAVRSQPHIPIPGSGSSPATCQHVISIFVSSATLSLLCHRVIVCKQLNSSILDEWSMSVISDKSSNNVSQLLLLCHSWLTVYVRQKTVSNLSRKLIFFKANIVMTRAANSPPMAVSASPCLQMLSSCPAQNIGHQVLMISTIHLPPIAESGYPGLLMLTVLT